MINFVFLVFIHLIHLLPLKFFMAVLTPKQQKVFLHFSDFCFIAFPPSSVVRISEAIMRKLCQSIYPLSYNDSIVCKLLNLLLLLFLLQVFCSCFSHTYRKILSILSWGIRVSECLKKLCCWGFVNFINHSKFLPYEAFFPFKISQSQGTWKKLWKNSNLFLW